MKLQDTSLHETIQTAYNDTLHFLDDILASSSAVNRNVPNDLIALADLRELISRTTPYIQLTSITISVQTSFLSTLFKYRQIFRRIASRAVIPGTAAPIIVCWVDVLLVKLGEVTVFIAGGFAAEEPERASLLPSLKIQREDDKLMAAAQLPRKTVFGTFFELN
jgi:hypothetical protein